MEAISENTILTQCSLGRKKMEESKLKIKMVNFSENPTILNK